MNGKRMKVIGIISQKGGTGKTTLATNLSVEAERHGHTVALFDLDPQATTAKWGDHREADTPAIMDIPASRLDHWLDIASENGATLAIVDTAPSTNYEIPDIIKGSSVVLIPCKPSMADVDAIKNTVTVAEQEKKPAYVILNMVRPNTNLGKEARNTIENNYNAACLPFEIGERVGFIHAYNSGASVTELEPYSKSADEIRKLYAYLAEQMEM